MAYTIQPSAIIEVRWRSASQGSEVENVFHYRYGGQTITDGADAAKQVALSLHSNGANAPLQYWSQIAANLVSIYQTEAQWIYPIRYGMQSSQPAPAVFGLDASPPLPPNTAASIEFPTDIAKRGKRGRIAVFGIGESKAVTIAGLWNDGTKVTLGQMGAAIRAFTTTPGPIYGPFTHILYNRKNPADSVTSNNAVFKDTIRVQRRRTLRVGK